VSGPVERRNLAAEGVESLGRIRLQGIALLVLAFLSGAVAGGAVERVRDRHAPRGGRAELGFLKGPNGIPPAFEKLDLTPAQRDEIARILERRRPVADSILRSSLPRLRAMMDSTRSEIRAVLTPVQRAKLDQLFGRPRASSTMRAILIPRSGPAESVESAARTDSGGVR
jgi:Spy/CpxP family protein refolding chaperone